MESGLVRAPQCAASDGMFAVAEAALEGGVEACFVTDGAGRMIGVVKMTAIRDAVKSGGYRRPLTAADLMTPATSAIDGALIDAAPVLDEGGRLVGMRRILGGQTIPVAAPSLGAGELRNLTDALLSTWISSTGEYIRDLEAQFAAWCGAKHGVAVSNGTVSLQLAMATLGIGPGDEVIVPDLTFAASINTVIHAGATPVIVDVDLESWCLSAETFERAITPRTKAVMPVHVFGRPAPMDKIAEIARARGIFVIEDCAEAHGAKVHGRRVGTYSDISSFSFFANKIMTTGEGGICLTDDDALAERMRFLRDHGMKRDPMYWHTEPGFNFRMTNLQAAIGCAQVGRLDALLRRRVEVMNLYERAFADIPGVRLPSMMPRGYEPVVWFCCALVPPEKRAALIAACKAVAIDVRPFFHALSVMPAYSSWPATCPNAVALSNSGVNLPTSDRVDEEIVNTIAKIFREVLAS